MIKTKLKNLFIIKNKNFKDQRGYFKEIIRENKLKKKFPFLVMSYSKQNVVRGLHIQTKNSQGKFVTVIKGKIFDVAIVIIYEFMEKSQHQYSTVDLDKSTGTCMKGRRGLRGCSFEHRGAQLHTHPLSHPHSMRPLAAECNVATAVKGQSPQVGKFFELSLQHRKTIRPRRR